MKSRVHNAFIILSFLFSSILFARDVKEFKNTEQIAKLYSQSTLPDFSPWLGKTIPGRCFFKTPDEIKTASVLIPTLMNGQMFLAPLSADKRAANFFDEMSLEEILSRFPQIAGLYRPIYENQEEAILYRKKGERNYEARIRQLDDLIFIKVILLNQEVRYCYYQISNT